MTGTLLRGVGGLYTVAGGDGAYYTLRCRGKLRREVSVPLPGDEVDFTPGAGETHGWLERVLPRKSVCARPPVANLERLVIVVAPVPAPDLLLADRLIVRAAREGVDALLCVNKLDVDGALAARLAGEYAGSGVPVFPVSARTGEGLEALRAEMLGRLCCLAGPSGVGKSTLLARLMGLALKTGEVSGRIGRGRHTTRHAELLDAGGLRVFDTPGFSLLSLESMEPEELCAWYPEMAGLMERCRFQPCLHDREPGCAVTEAAAAGALSPARLERYRTLLAEVRAAWKGRYE